MPGAVAEPTVIVIVEVPAPRIEAGLNATVTPVGAPDADNDTAEENPPVTALVMVDVPALPCSTETEAGEAERLNPAVCGAVRAAIKPAFGLPHPVTRS